MAQGNAVAQMYQVHVIFVDELSLRDPLVDVSAAGNLDLMLYNQGSDSKGYNPRDSYGSNINSIVSVSSLFSVQP